MSYGKDTSSTGDFNVDNLQSQRDPQLQSQGQGQLDQPSTTGGYQESKDTSTRDTGYGGDTTQGRVSDTLGYGDRNTAQHHHLHRSDEPLPRSSDTGAGQDTEPHGLGRDTSTTHGRDAKNDHEPIGTVPGTSLPAVSDDTGDVRRGASRDTGDNRGHEGLIGRHEERKEARREQDIGTGGGTDTGSRDVEGVRGEGPFERHEQRKEGLYEGGGTGVTGRGHHHHHHHHEGPIEHHEERKEARREEGTGTGTGTGILGAGVGGTDYSDTGRGIHAQQYERHPGEHLGGGRQGWEGQGLGHGGQNVAAQQAASAGTGGVGAGYGDTQRAGAGYGDTQRAGAGYGDTQRQGDTGYGVGTTGTGAHHTDTGAGQGKVSKTDKIIGGGEKLAGKLTSKPGLYEQGQQRQHGVYEPQPKQ